MKEAKFTKGQSVEKARLLAVFDEGQRQIRTGATVEKAGQRMVRGVVRASNSLVKQAHRIVSIGRKLVDQGEKRRETAHYRAENLMGKMASAQNPKARGKKRKRPAKKK